MSRATLPTADAAHSYDGDRLVVAILVVVVALGAGLSDQLADGVEPEKFRDLLGVSAELPREPEPFPGVLEIQFEVGAVDVDDELATVLTVAVAIAIAVAVQVGVGDSGDCEHCGSREAEDDALH